MNSKSDLEFFVDMLLNRDPKLPEPESDASVRRQMARHGIVSTLVEMKSSGVDIGRIHIQLAKMGVSMDQANRMRQAAIGDLFFEPDALEICYVN
jgi:TATA-binding protein-associated factor Taf7